MRIPARSEIRLQRPDESERKVSGQREARGTRLNFCFSAMARCMYVPMSVRNVPQPAIDFRLTAILDIKRRLSIALPALVRPTAVSLPECTRRSTSRRRDIDVGHSHFLQKCFISSLQYVRLESAAMLHQVQSALPNPATANPKVDCIFSSEDHRDLSLRIVHSSRQPFVPSIPSSHRPSNPARTPTTSRASDGSPHLRAGAGLSSLAPTDP